MRLAIDVMGGDHAPDAILAGCIDALVHLKADDRLILVGDEAIILDTLRERSVRDDRLDVVHAPEVIGMHEPPARAVRAKADSSIVQAARLGSARGGPSPTPSSAPATPAPASPRRSCT